MDDLISRQAVLDILSEVEAEVEDGDGFRYDYWRDHVKTMASAERKGKWIYPTDIIGFGRCGNCKALWDIGLIRNKFFRYCPRCGSYNGGGNGDE